jgi:hypothetical protein
MVQCTGVVADVVVVVVVAWSWSEGIRGIIRGVGGRQHGNCQSVASQSPATSTIPVLHVMSVVPRRTRRKEGRRQMSKGRKEENSRLEQRRRKLYYGNKSQVRDLSG